MFLKKRVKKFIFRFLLVYICVVGGLYLAQRSMIYFPDKNKPDISPYIKSGVVETTVTTSDDLLLSGWLKKPENQKNIIVFFHGNFSHHGLRIHKTAPYIRDGFGVLLAGYRGYGGNAGSPSEQGFYDDARAWIDQLVKNGALLEDIIVYGESVGTGVAVQMAVEYPDIKALILESPYTSLPDIAAKTYFFIPVSLLMKDKFNNLSKIKNVKTPVLIIQGLKDKVVPAVLGQKLFAEASGTKEIFQLEEYGHNDIPSELISSKVIEFLDKN